ncbi:hypothetical protein [Derxia lacustris]|uniref:hypothetical protein n=1 Tax=Derxia lacustris TaxID=764842 RepID=UPI000A16F57E|nr:hypothetical protein [Derxia lacustris]
MKKIVTLALAIAGATALPAGAHEIGVLFDQQGGRSQDSSTTSVDMVKPRGKAIRGAYTLLDLAVTEVAITGTWHDKADDDIVSAPPSGYTRGSFSYVALGAQVDWKLLLNVNAGLEMRREKVTLDRSGGGSEDQSFTRPWARLGLGWSLPLPVVSPFVRLEAGYALTHDSLPANASASDFAKAIAPRYQVGVYGGVRF